MLCEMAEIIADTVFNINQSINQSIFSAGESLRLISFSGFYKVIYHCGKIQGKIQIEDFLHRYMYSIRKKDKKTTST